MLTLRFDLPESDNNVLLALREHLLPVQVDAQGIAGVHLCSTDTATSAIETAEKKARSEGTRIPGWVLMVEGTSLAAVQAVGAHVRAALGPMGVSAFDEACYQFEHQRCKLPAGDG